MASRKHFYLHRDLGSIKLSFEILAKLLKISSGGSNDIYDGGFKVFQLHLKDLLSEMEGNG